MQYVTNRYYYWYNRICVGIAFLILAMSVGAWISPSLLSLGQSGFNMIASIIALAQITYGLFVFRNTAVTSPWIAGLFSSMLLTLSIINLMHNTGQFHSMFTVLWLIQIFFSGLFGIYAVVGYYFIITLYFVIVATGQMNAGQPDKISVLAVLASYVIGLTGYVLWRRFYIDAETRRVKQLTGQLQTNQQQAEILIESISDGMIVITMDGKIGLINPAASKLTGWGIEEATGLDASLVIKLKTEEGEEVDDSQNPLKQVFVQSKTVSANMQLIGKGLKPIIVSVVVSPVILPKTKTVNGAVAILRDISVERAEEKRRADFISTASHEMRTPVAAIEGYLALALNNKVSSIDVKARSYLEKAHSSTQHLGKLFQDLLTSARAEDGRLVNHPIVVEMGSYLEQLTDSLRFAAEKKGLLMDFVIGGEQKGTAGMKVVRPLYYVHVDADRIREVITNLFDNATKYTETGKVTIGLTGNAEVIQFYIKDTGQGIPAEDVPHLFQKFYRVDSSATRTIGGTGLGLFICRKIVELYNGRIWVESELDKGSTFYINLPRLTSQKAGELQAAEAAQKSYLTSP